MFDWAGGVSNFTAWVAATAAALGIGAALFAVLLPAAAGVVFDLVARALGALIATRLGCAVLAALVGGIVGGMYYSDAEKKKCAAEIQRINDAARERDKTVTREANANAAAKITTLEQQVAAHARTIAEFAKTNPGGACVVTPDDIR